MAAARHAIPIRSARDRLIDLLGIGDTYPLTDLNVVADQLKVPFGGTAKIPIENAQAGVTYELCDPKGEPLGAAFKADGGDATLLIDTPPVNEDVTYRIRATKKTPESSTLSAQAPRFLDEAAPVKVGLDTGLMIEIAGYSTRELPTPVPAPLLDPSNANPQPSDPRIVPFAASVDVRVNRSQEGVQYSLRVDGQDLPDVAVTGNLGSIILRTGPMHEDAIIQVRATKTFLAAENRTSETELLDAKLYLKVIANPGLAVSIEAGPIVEYGQDATVKLASTQQSAKYRAHVHRIPDRDFLHGTATGTDVVVVPVAGKPSVQVLKPHSGMLRVPDGYAPLGDAAIAGSGGNLAFAVKALTDDTMIIIQAIKEHQVEMGNPDAGSIPSSIRLEQAVAVLVRPDPARALTLRVPVTDAQTGQAMRVSNGQPGVFYYFRQAPAGAEFAWPAYFHKRDEQDGNQNKGLGQLGVEIDLAIARDPDVERTGAPGDPARTYPPWPLLRIPRMAADSSLASRAIKAQTAVEAPMSQIAQIAAVPAIHPDQALVDYGSAATIVIPASAPPDHYQLLLDGAAVKPALPGNNGDLSVVTDPLTADATFELVVTRPQGKGMPVERVIEVTVTVRPNASLPVSAKQDTVDKGAGTDILVQSTQPRVVYRLMSGQNAVGAPVPGTGATIALPTGPITADTTFGVTAARADDAQIAVVLNAQVTVKLRASA